MIESATASQTNVSAFLSSTQSATEKLERARTELLDLSARNRLLNIPRKSKTSRIIEVVDEKSDEIFRILVSESKVFTFLPGRASGTQSSFSDAESDEINDLAQPDESVNERGVFNRHVDTKLQTRLTSKGLQTRLLDLYTDARILEEEQGVNILFLALGTLKWLDPNNAKNERYAPLILIPVSLERGNAAEQFKLKWRQEDPAANLSLETFLDKVHSLKLPSLEIGDDFNPATYYHDVALAITSKQGWSINPDDIVLGFFSFAKFLMYRDLESGIWPVAGGLTELPLIRGLLTDGFPHSEALIPDDAVIDQYIAPADLLHIVDCDSSQSIAVHDVRQGRNLIIQGPPGTGKSQTIANVIAAAIADGKTILFVAEKMAALEVVKRRLDQAGVGDACLELHSNKANKKLMLDELRRTAELGPPKGEFPTTLNARLQQVRDYLNFHADRMHIIHANAGMTPYQVIGQLTRLRQEKFAPVDIKFERPETWTRDEREVRQEIVMELAERIKTMGIPSRHPWHGILLPSILPNDVERLMVRINDLKTRTINIHQSLTVLASAVELSPPTAFHDFTESANLARRIASAPPLSGIALNSPVWRIQQQEITRLLEHGQHFSRLSNALADKVTASAWRTNVHDLRIFLGKLPRQFSPNDFARTHTLNVALPKLQAEAVKLEKELGSTKQLDTIATIKRTILTGERVAAAPDVSAEVFAAHVWDHGVEQAADLANLVADFEKIKGALHHKVNDAAWSINTETTRQAIAIHGQSLWRFISSDWRKANALVKTILKTPNPPHQEQIDILDQLAMGQKALLAIRANDDFGKIAFGADWRAERSSAVPLQALVAWMRSLRGLGAEPRLLASRLPDRTAIGERALRTQTLLAELRPLLGEFEDACMSMASESGADPRSIEDISLAELIQQIKRICIAHQQCESIISPMPEHLSESLAILDRLSEAQNIRCVITSASELGLQAFDKDWHDIESDWQLLAHAAEWIKDNHEICALVARNQNRVQAANQASLLETELTSLLETIHVLLANMFTNCERLFDVRRVSNIPIADLVDRLSLWIAHEEELSGWVAYRGRVDTARTLGLGQLVDQLESGTLPVEHAARTFEMAYYEALFTDQVAQQPALANFDGHLHSGKVSEFTALDQQRIESASLEVAHAHHKKIPQGGGGVGPLGVLRGEMARRRGHMPIRQLMLRAAPALQALKPVFMMSPLSVAQFLPPGQLSFDLLVMDEASQIQPVDALGAIARCHQVVVVGDERQLPPTQFFSKVTSGQDDDNDEDGAQVSDIESILGLFRARGLPQRMLRWHYRSRHQSLIAVSNSQFYENKLFIVPSPYTQEAGMGLQFQHVANGIFDSGNSGTNAVEAKAVAEAVIRHAKSSPAHSLGVATFSVAQRKAIQDQLELLRRANPDSEPFFNSHPHEPFFIKNLENVQGDERDVILISVGYGRNAQGYMAMRFGPLSAEGGERRLNVLISRAKRRCEVFASITDEDIDLERGKGKGVFAFKLFLHFARTGRLGIAQKTGRDHDSPFEVQVAKALQEHGFQVHPQVGIAGFFIDLAIADSSCPGRYLLGIECDGASYHSSHSARDRDRLRQAVLEDHGWIIHRVWSMDWFQRPHKELQRVLAAIDAAKRELEERLESNLKQKRAVPVNVVTIERGDVVEIGLAQVGDNNRSSQPYIEACPTKPNNVPELHETPISILQQLICDIVVIEGPIHVDEIVIRLRNAWGLKRAGTRIQASVELGIAAAVASKAVSKRNHFLSTPSTKIAIRDRGAVQSDSLRKPEMLPPLEIDAAILETLKINFGGNTPEVIQSVARLFGFKATSSQLRDAILARIHILVKEGVLEQQNDMLKIR